MVARWRRLAATIAACLLLASCVDKPASTESAASFETAAATALKTPSFDNIERVRELFEALGKNAGAVHLRTLDRLADAIEADWPVETLRLRMLQAEQQGLDPVIATKVARALATANFNSRTAEFLANTPVPPAGDQDDPLRQHAQRIVARDTLAQSLGLQANTPSARRLLDILSSSIYAEADSTFWAARSRPLSDQPQASAVVDGEAGDSEEEAEDNTPLMRCEPAQFDHPQFIGNTRELVRKYGPEQETAYVSSGDADEELDDYAALARLAQTDPLKAAIWTRNRILDRRPGSMFDPLRPGEDFLRLAFKAHPVLSDRPARWCEASGPMAPQVRQSALELARQAGVAGQLGQSLCVEDAAVLLLAADSDLATVVVLKPAGAGTEIWTADDLDNGYIRKVRGRAQRDLLLVGNRAGAHGYASAAVYDLAARSKLFAVNGLHFGNIVVFAGSPAHGDTIGLQFAVAEGREDCGQCPRYRKFVALDPSEGGYKVSAEMCSAQEIASDSAGFMSLNAMASVVGSDSLLGIGSYRAFAQKALRDGEAPAAIAVQIAKNLEELSSLQLGMGDFAGVQSRAEEALDAFRTLPQFDSTQRSATYHFANLRLMEALIYQSRHGDATELGERALLDPFIARDPERVADYANRLSVVHLRRGTFPLALKYLQQALSSPAGANLSATTGNMAWYSNLAKDYRRGSYYAARAVSAALREESGRVGINARLLADSRFSQGSATEALDWLAHGLVHSHTQSASDVVALQVGAANIAEAVNDTRFGILLLDQAMIRMDEVTWETEASEFLLTHGRLLARQGRHDDAMVAIRRIDGLTVDRRTNTRVEAALMISRFYDRSGDAGAALQVARDAFMDSMKVSTSWAGETFQLASAEFARAAADWYFHLLLKAQRPAAEIAYELARWKGFVLKEGLFPAPADSKASDVRVDVRTRLRPGELFVDYFIGQEAAYAISASSTSLKLVRLKVSAAQVARLAQSVQLELDVRRAAARDAIARQRVTPELRAALHELHDKLLQPVLAGERARYLFISPDNAVGGISWPALMDRQDAYVGERFATLLVPGSFLFAQSDKCDLPHCQRRTRVGLVGNTQAISYAQAGQGPRVLAPLRYARREIVRVRNLWSARIAEHTDLQAPPVRGTTLDWLGRHAKDLALLHMVGHGSFNHQDSLDSQLFIEPARSARPFVTAKELAGFDLDGMGVAVISACESGALGNQGGGEPLGLVRAFLAAGTSQVVASQWQIDDNAALVLTSAFHENLSRASPIDALFAAQRTTARKFPHPYFWAPMQLYGRPLRQVVLAAH